MTHSWRVRGGAIPLVRPLIMGILNATPDSFSDGGRLDDEAAAVEHGRSLAAAGADVIDVGGESSRPGAQPVAEDVELARVVGVVGALASDGLIVSIDTMKPGVAAAAVAAGARIVNDVGGLGDPRMREVVVETGAGVVAMHMRGTPATMQDDPTYRDVTREVAAFLVDRTETAIDAGVDPDCLVVDPGIGFGKTVAHNLTLLHHLDVICDLGYPVLVGTSRKGFLGVVTGEGDPASRDLASAVSSALAIGRGASMVRVHDVARAVESARVGWAIVREAAAGWDPVAIEEGVGA